MEEEMKSNISKQRLEIPIWKKVTMTIDEAAVYSGIGRSKLRFLCERNNCTFVLRVGKKRLIKRKQLDEFIEKTEYV